MRLFGKTVSWPTVPRPQFAAGAHGAVYQFDDACGARPGHPCGAAGGVVPA